MADEYIEATTTGRITLGLIYGVGALLIIGMNLWWHPFMEWVRNLPLCQQLP